MSAEQVGANRLIRRRLALTRHHDAVAAVQRLAGAADLGLTRQVVVAHLLGLAAGIAVSDDPTFVPLENLETVSAAIEDWLAEPLLADLASRPGNRA